MVENIDAPGTFYGIGVGPGDPDLIPVKSVKILGKVKVIFAAASTKNPHSQAVNIARPHIPKTADVRLLAFPMTRDKNETRQAWISHAKTIIEVLKQGQDAVFLTLGDTMTYSTYGYLLPHIQQMAPEIPIVTIPGITSYQAAAARINKPLVEGEESMVVLSGAKGGDRLRRFADKTENIILLKAYKNVKDIVAALDEFKMGRSSTGVARCGLPGEEIIHDIHEMVDREPGYWTLILAKKNGFHEAE